MVNLLRKLRRRSVEKRVVRTCLFPCVSSRDLHELMMNNRDLLEAEVVEDMDVDDKRIGQQESERRRTPTITNGKGLNERSGEQSIKIDTSGGPDVQSYLAAGGNDGGVHAPQTRKYISGGFQSIQKERCNEWCTLVATGGLKTDPKRRTHFSDLVLLRMLSFLLRTDNVLLLSWGTNRVEYGGSVHRFPAVIRNTSADGLWSCFNDDEMGIGNNVRLVGRTVFRSIVEYLIKAKIELR